MQSENPNLFAVQEAYDSYYETHPFKKNQQTQQYKRWVRQMEMYANPQGYYQAPHWSKKNEQQYLKSRGHSLSKDGENSCSITRTNQSNR